MRNEKTRLILQQIASLRGLLRLSLVPTAFLMLSCGAFSTKEGASSGTSSVRFQIGGPLSEGASIQSACPVRSLRILDLVRPGSGVRPTPPIVLNAEAINPANATANEEIIRSGGAEVQVERGGPRRFAAYGAVNGCGISNATFHMAYGSSPEISVEGPTEVAVNVLVAKAPLEAAQENICTVTAPLGCVLLSFTGASGSASQFNLTLRDVTGNVVSPIPSFAGALPNALSVKNLIVGVPVILEMQWLSSTGSCVHRVLRGFTGSNNVVGATEIDLTSVGC